MTLLASFLWRVCIPRWGFPLEHVAPGRSRRTQSPDRQEQMGNRDRLLRRDLGGGGRRGSSVWQGVEAQSWALLTFNLQSFTSPPLRASVPVSQVPVWGGSPQVRSFVGLLSSHTSNLQGADPLTCRPQSPPRLTFPSLRAQSTPAPARLHLKRLWVPGSRAPQECWALW